MPDELFNRSNQILDAILAHLDIPDSYYQKAVERYQHIGEWLHRADSTVRRFNPKVYAQGSFQYGTVNRPLLAGESYDLDIVIELEISKGSMSQADLKRLLGNEIKAYAQRYQVNAPVEEKRRVWCLEYADEVSFHIDNLPSVPMDENERRNLARFGVHGEWAATAIGITDREHLQYERISYNWPVSNPRGYALWFRMQMGPIAKHRAVELVQKGHYASIDKVPEYKLKTPLQRVIQLLKRHRDVMFNKTPDLKPISMILTTLAGLAYNGESDTYSALRGIVDRMLSFVLPQAPRIANPVDQREDFADKWRKNAALELNFRRWHQQIVADSENMIEIARGSASAEILTERFGVSDAIFRSLGRSTPTITVAARPRPTVIRTPPKAWGHT